MSKISGFGLSNHPLSDHFERSRGIFTPSTDRPFLINHEEPPSDRAEYDRHEEIRKRLLNGIIDFQLAQRHLGKWNWRKFLDLDTTQDRELRNGMVAAMALFYEIHHAKDWSFNNTLYRAIEGAYSTGATERTMPPRHVENVDFEVEAYERGQYGMDLERVAQKIAEGAELTDREIAFAARMGWYDVLDEYFSKEKRRERLQNNLLEKAERMSFGEFEE